MAWPEPAYRRITRRLGIPLVASAALYEADDHVLEVTQTFGIEKYRRFHFRDIQTVTIQQTKRRLITSLSLAGVTFFLALMMLIPIHPIWHIVWGALTLLGVIAIGIDLLRGPTAALRISTPVQDGRLWSVGRLPRALTAAETIRARAADAQKPPEPESATRSPADASE